MKRSISSFYWGKIGFQQILFEIRLFCCVISLITWRQRKLLKPSLPKMVRSFSSLSPAFKAIWSIILITNSNPIFGWAGHAVQWCVLCWPNIPLSSDARVWGNLSSWLMDLVTECPDNLKDNTFINYSCRCWQIQLITTYHQHKHYLPTFNEWSSHSHESRYTSEHFWGNWVN